MSAAGTESCRAPLCRFYLLFVKLGVSRAERNAAGTESCRAPLCRFYRLFVKLGVSRAERSAAGTESSHTYLSVREERICRQGIIILCPQGMFYFDLHGRGFRAVLQAGQVRLVRRSPQRLPVLIIPVRFVRPPFLVASGVGFRLGTI